MEELDFTKYKFYNYKFAKVPNDGLIKATLNRGIIDIGDSMTWYLASMQVIRQVPIINKNGDKHMLVYSREGYMEDTDMFMPWIFPEEWLYKRNTRVMVSRFLKHRKQVPETYVLHLVFWGKRPGLPYYDRILGYIQPDYIYMLGKFI